MKDGFDKETNELDLSVKRSRGRPGKVVTEENFYFVLSYFEKKRYLDTKKQAGIKAIRLAAPVEQQSSTYIKKQIDSHEAYLASLIARRESFGSDPFDLHLSKTEFLRRSDSDISYTQERLANLRKHVQLPLAPELVRSLQEWVNAYVSKEDWTRCLNLQSQKAVNKRIAKTKMTIKTAQYKQLLKLKAELGAESWDEAFDKMMWYTEAALKKNR